MALDSVSQLGKALGESQREQENIKQNISPNDPVAQFPQLTTESLVIEQCYTVIKKNNLSDSFVIDHPTLGEIDSATLQIDGGYGEDDIFITTCTTSVAISPAAESLTYSIKYPSVNISTPTAEIITPGVLSLNSTVLTPTISIPGGTITGHGSLGTNLDAYWAMDGDYTDDIGSNDGAVTGDVVATDTGHLGNAATFPDGSSDYITVTDVSVLQNIFSGGGSISAWVYVDTGQSNYSTNTICFKNAYQISCAINTGDNYKIYVQHTFSGNNGSWYTTNNNLAAGSWNHVVVMYDNSNTSNIPTVYINGVSQSMITNQIPTGSATSDVGYNFEIGGRASFGSHSLKGKIDEVGVWSKTLTVGEISDLYNSGSGLPYN